jgi:hypothetical protein
VKRAMGFDTATLNEYRELVENIQWYKWNPSFVLHYRLQPGQT